MNIPLGSIAERFKQSSISVNRTMLAALFGLAMTSACFGDDSWPGFRGDGSGIAKANVPTQWSPTEGVAWQASIPGYGQSSPVVWNNKIYVTSSEGPFQEDCQVHAFDLQSGKKLWTSHIA
ncbi:MAG: PQQ-binding-like beta-propeller repeat protein, partial [Planctomycetaceae bacterium]|nr:PQQ-binding-like beta-propeller repeat protein [Planctomycetaceae bacterium]